MNILDNIFYRAADSARQCSADVNSAALVAIQLLAWRKVSEREGEELSGTYLAALESTPRTCYDQACGFISMTLNVQADLPEAWAHPELQKLMLWLQGINLGQLENGRQLAQGLSRELGRKMSVSLPQELVSLLVALLGDLTNKSIYCPFDSFFQFSVEAESLGGADVVAEIPFMTPLPAAIKILSNLNFEFGFSNPIYRPYFRDTSGALRQFDLAVCNPPWGSQMTMDYREDPFGRFRGDERSIEHHAIRHLLHQVRGTSVILVPMGILFGSQMGLKGLRKELVLSGKLRAVVSLPSGLLQSISAASALLVIDSQGGNAETLLIDADNARYNTRDGRSRSRLEGWKQLCTDFGLGMQGEQIDTGRLVTKDEIESQDFQLQVNRYLKSPSASLVQQYFSQHRHCMLGELVDVLRPSLLDKEKGIEAFEVALTDFPPVGYVRSATKPVHIIERKNLADLFLRQDDIIIVVKGALSILGKVALIDSQAHDRRWVANQMSLILRAEPSRIDPRFLYRYLQSDLAREQIKNLNLGSTIPNLRPNDLKAVLVPLPPLEEQHKIVENFRQIVGIQEQMEELTRRRDMLAVSEWPSIVFDHE